MVSEMGKDVLGENLFLLVNMALQNQNLCKLLYYTVKDPFLQPDIENADELLLHRNILITPKIPDSPESKGSYIVFLVNGYDRGLVNYDIKTLSLYIDILCPTDEWLINNWSLRPFLIVNELEQMFDKLKLKGIGRLILLDQNLINAGEELSGYRLEFTNNEFK